MIFGGKNWMYGVKWSQKEIALRAWEIKADSLFARKNILAFNSICLHLTPFNSFKRLYSQIKVEQAKLKYINL